MSRWAGSSLVLAIDKPIHRIVLEQVLAPEGFDISQVGSETDLLEEAAGAAPDVVLIDSELPVHGGLHACKALHGQPSLAGIPVLILSSRGDAVDAFHAGAEDVVEWPIRPDILLAQDSGKRPSVVIPVRLKEALTSATALMQNRFDDKNVHLDVAQFENADGVEVWADPMGLVHGGICNLLSNALKFSSPGGRVAIDVEPNGNTCALVIRDEGVGIPKTLLPRLFKLDVATSRVGTASERGTGFGLPLVKRVLDRCGGSISLESKDIEDFPDGHGTIARVILRRVDGKGVPT